MQCKMRMRIVCSMSKDRLHAREIIGKLASIQLQL